MSLEGDTTKRDWLEEIALFSRDKTLGLSQRISQLLIRTCFYVLVDCNYSSQLSDLTPGHKEGRRQPLRTGSA